MDPYWPERFFRIFCTISSSYGARTPCEAGTRVCHARAISPFQAYSMQYFAHGMNRKRDFAMGFLDAWQMPYVLF